MRVAVVALIGQPRPVGDCPLACGTAIGAGRAKRLDKTFLWFGGCFAATYLGVREEWPLGARVALFAGLSVVMERAEQALLGSEVDHFSHVFEGNAAYVGGWSFAAGLCPALTLVGRRLAGRRVPRLMAV